MFKKKKEPGLVSDYRRDVVSGLSVAANGWGNCTANGKTSCCWSAKAKKWVSIDPVFQRIIRRLQFCTRRGKAGRDVIATNYMVTPPVPNAVGGPYQFNFLSQKDRSRRRQDRYPGTRMPCVLPHVPWVSAVETPP